MKKKLAVLLSQYQLELFIQLNLDKDLEGYFYITTSSIFGKLKLLVPQNNIHVFDKGNISIGILRSRSEIKGIRKFLKEKGLSKNDELWVANDEHQIDQCVYNMIGFNCVNMIEDGIGSYIKHKFLKYNYGFLNVLRKIKLFVNYFPYYRAFYGCGGNIKATRVFSYYPDAFPMQSTSNRCLAVKDYKYTDSSEFAPDCSTIFIGQPLIQLKYIDAAEYLELIKHIKNQLEPGAKLFYKAHPQEKDLDFLKDVDLVIIKAEFLPVEDYVYFSGNNLKVYSFISTSLLHIKMFSNVDTLVSIKLKNMSALKPYYQFLDSFGIEVIQL